MITKAMQSMVQAMKEGSNRKRESRPTDHTIQTWKSIKYKSYHNPYHHEESDRDSNTGDNFHRNFKKKLKVEGCLF